MMDIQFCLELHWCLGSPEGIKYESILTDYCKVVHCGKRTSAFHGQGCCCQCMKQQSSAAPFLKQIAPSTWGEQGLKIKALLASQDGNNMAICMQSCNCTKLSY